MPYPLVLGADTGQRDTHRLAILVGDRVLVIAYGYGARLGDVGENGVVAGVARTRLVVDLGHETRSIGGCCLAVLDRTEETDRQQGNLARAPHLYAAGDNLDRMTLDHTVACRVCDRGEGDLIHAAAVLAGGARA